MDGFQTAVTSLAVVAIVILMVLIVCHYLGPRATAWVRSNREEKIGLSNNKLYNANGYLVSFELFFKIIFNLYIYILYFKLDSFRFGYSFRINR